MSWVIYAVFSALAAVALDRTSVAMVFILAILFLGEKFQIRSAVGAVLVVSGAILMSLK